eukprot:comp23458_c0_seq1/m.39168 comp23458_c0_seq1/g.39168  ORF comp23458_c0_seq1/g.39168 comp23458_c0_seq1/m.39168 type:complete len:630 (-) comp23458_c0_seq1:353-2242(-)
MAAKEVALSSFGAYVCTHVQGAGTVTPGRRRYSLTDGDRTAQLLQLLENAADFFFYRKRIRFFLCAEELYRHSRAFAAAQRRGSDTVHTASCQGAAENDRGEEGNTWVEFVERLAALLQRLWDSYLGAQWARADQLVRANKIRKDLLLPHTKRDEECDVGEAQRYFMEVVEGCVEEVSDGNGAALTSAGCCVVLFHIHHCPHCRTMRPAFFAAARALKGQVKFYTVDGLLSPGLQTHYQVSRYPTVLRFRDGKVEAQYPRGLAYTLDSLLAFARSEQGTVGDGDGQGSKLWQLQRKMSLKDSLVKQLQGQREFVSLAESIRALGCEGEEECRAMTRPHGPDDDPPTIIFMGGGMGSGKSTVVGKLTGTEFWRKHGSQVVIIEADAMKLKDPVYQALSLVDEEASRDVHDYSVRTAEELFLSAIKYRRDIVFDGTMSWAPFVAQTVAMVRDTANTYRRGPGYVVQGDGSVSEQYWVPVGPCSPGVPYRIEMVGVTVDPDVAVQRAIVRQVVTGRGVPVKAQLQSHQLFSKHFDEYVALFDKVALYDNSSMDTLLTETPAQPQLIASKDVGGLLLVHPPSYARFMSKATLNVDASNRLELQWGTETQQQAQQKEETAKLGRWLWAQLLEPT